MTDTHDPLRYWRNELADAEGRLRNARDSLRKAAESNGRSSGLFSETFFVPRSTAERWVETAEQKFFEREKQNFEYVKEALGALAASKAKDDSPGKRTDLEPKAGAGRLPGDNNDTLHTANAIIAAGQKRTGESDAKPPTLTVVERPPPPRMTVVPDAQMPPKGSLAEKIILAGMRRRGEIE